MTRRLHTFTVLSGDRLGDTQRSAIAVQCAREREEGIRVTYLAELQFAASDEITLVDVEELRRFLSVGGDSANCCDSCAEDNIGRYYILRFI
jgi:hypothetical protein